MGGFLFTERFEGSVAHGFGGLQQRFGLGFAGIGQAKDAFAFVFFSGLKGYPAFFPIFFADIEHRLFGQVMLFANLFLRALPVFRVGKGVEHSEVGMGQTHFFYPVVYQAVDFTDMSAEYVEAVHRGDAVGLLDLPNVILSPAFGRTTRLVPKLT
ncbi:MAG: hypothetical protein Q4A16_10910 [Lautropia sp.]|nr:hypothetical protein [Lautropia sp.]